MTNGDVKGLPLNRDIVQRNNSHHTHKIKTKGVTNQKSSGRCWLFASLNVLRPAVIEKQRLLSLEGAPGHAMVLIGVDIKDDKPVKWLVENSWGSGILPGT